MTIKKQEIYVSTDVETNGPIPGTYSMLSFASAAFTSDKNMVDTFSINLHTLEHANEHPDTMQWWAKNTPAWEAARKDCVTPELAMKKYFNWLKALPGKPVFVGYPVAFDFMFVYWYLMNFVGESPFSHSALDIKTLAMSVLKKEYRHSTKKNMPKHWFDPSPHTHIALDDAIEQGHLFCNILKESRCLKEN